MKLYKALNLDAKNWWVNKELRARGKNGEARIKEREQIKKRIKNLRLAKQVGAYITMTNFYPGIIFAEHSDGPYSTKTISISGMDRDLLRIISETCNIRLIELENAPPSCYNALLEIKPDLSNLDEIINKIEQIKSEV